MRRLADLVLAVLGLVLLAVPMAAIALAIRLMNGRPVLFVQTRVGRKFRPFQLLKFRTMAAPRPGSRSITVGEDPRTTPLGRRLRRYHLDELPQLLNILRGDMSFIGPRPEIPEFVDDGDPVQIEVYGVRPGLFDSATLHWLDEHEILGQVDNWEDFYHNVVLPDKLARSLSDIRNRSFRRDVGLMLAVLGRIARRKTAGN